MYRRGPGPVAKAPKDGYTLHFNNISHSANFALYRRPRRRVLADAGVMPE